MLLLVFQPSVRTTLFQRCVLVEKRCDVDNAISTSYQRCFTNVYLTPIEQRCMNVSYKRWINVDQSTFFPRSINVNSLISTLFWRRIFNPTHKIDVDHDQLWYQYWSSCPAQPWSSLISTMMARQPLLKHDTSTANNIDTKQKQDWCQPRSSMLLLLIKLAG